LKLKCTRKYPRTFGRAGRTFTTWYERWNVLDSKGGTFKYWEITADTHLSYFLSNLLGHREALPLRGKQEKLFESIFTHTNRWKLFSQAEDILNRKDSKHALKFLADKFSIITLSEKLKGES